MKKKIHPNNAVKAPPPPEAEAAEVEAVEAEAAGAAADTRAATKAALVAYTQAEADADAARAALEAARAAQSDAVREIIRVRGTAAFRFQGREVRPVERKSGEGSTCFLKGPRQTGDLESF